MNLDKIKKIHFIGIGGIGVSAMAKLMLELNKKVTGSDLIDSEIIQQLKARGAKCFIGKHQAENVKKDFDLVIYSNAIPKNNLEIKQIVKLEIPCLSYPEFLGEFMKNKFPIIVSGTHGKSTTTAMLATILIEAGLDPTVIVGTKLNLSSTFQQGFKPYQKNLFKTPPFSQQAEESSGMVQDLFKGNERLGKSKYIVVEGDEYKEAFLNYTPKGLIINNIEADHLDYYKNLKNIISAFRKLIKKVPTHGVLVARADCENVKNVIKSAKCKVITFGIRKGDFLATHIIKHGELTRFAIKGPEAFDLALRVPGVHNALNALASTIMALALGIRQETIQKALLKYRGIWRRFEIKGEQKGITVIDDYAHHPTEIKATLITARQYFLDKKIWCVFQPHNRNRTIKLFKDFVHAFSDCDKLVLTEIYDVAGREHGEKISSLDLVKAIKKLKKDVTFIKDLKDITPYLIKKAKTGDVIITMGAGDITKVSDELIQKLK